MQRLRRRSPSPALVVAFIALFAAAGGGWAVAAQNAASTIRACVSKKTGAVRLSSRCKRKTERTVSWNAAGSDVLTRVFPATGIHVDLAYHAQKWAYTPHWVVTQPRDVDLGETTGSAIAFRPQQDEPTPTPTPTSNALPKAPSPPPWTTTTRDAGVTNPVETALVATTSAGEVVVDKANAAPFVAGSRPSVSWAMVDDEASEAQIELTQETALSEGREQARRITRAQVRRHGHPVAIRRSSASNTSRLGRSKKTPRLLPCAGSMPRRKRYRTPPKCRSYS